MLDKTTASMNRVATPVWDRTTRWFHWINVLCVLALAALGLAILNEKAFGVSAEGKVLLKTLHVYVGYVLAANLAWRLVWAFIGGQHARWKSFLPFGQGYASALRAYVGGFVLTCRQYHQKTGTRQYCLHTFEILSGLAPCEANWRRTRVWSR